MNKRIGSIQFTDGEIRPIFQTPDGRQFVRDLKGEMIFGVWHIPDEERAGPEDDDDTPIIVDGEHRERFSVGTITVRVAEAELRGTPFHEYAPVLDNLIGERFAVDLNVQNIAVEPGDRTAVFFDGNYTDRQEAAEILEMAREITDPAVKDGYFG